MLTKISDEYSCFKKIVLEKVQVKVLTKIMAFPIGQFQKNKLISFHLKFAFF